MGRCYPHEWTEFLFDKHHPIPEGTLSTSEWRPARHKKYHSGTICKGVSNPHTSNALSRCWETDG